MKEVDGRWLKLCKYGTSCRRLDLGFLVMDAMPGVKTVREVIDDVVWSFARPRASSVGPGSKA